MGNNKCFNHDFFNLCPSLLNSLLLYTLFLKGIPKTLESPFMTFAAIGIPIINVSSFGSVHLWICDVTAPAIFLATFLLTSVISIYKQEI